MTSTSRAGAAPTGRTPPERGKKRRGGTTTTAARAEATKNRKAARATDGFGELQSFVKREVEQRLKFVLDADRKRASAHGPDVTLMHEALTDLCLRGGKRSRAALVATGYRCALPKGDLEPALQAGVALELLQAYFLVHDDWMDQDRTRRGGPTVHRMLGRRLRDENLGAASAILAGDYLVALATRMLAMTEVPPRVLKRAFVSFAQMQQHAVMGQQLDLLARAKTIQHTYALKTASYSVAGPLELGARLGGGSRALSETLIGFGIPLGVAFQLRDDLLGVFGDPAETGKPFASDLLAGKRTLLVVLALEKLRGRARQQLAKTWGNRRASTADLERAAKLCEESGARAAVERRLTELVLKAEKALLPARLTRENYQLLEGASRMLTARAK